MEIKDWWEWDWIKLYSPSKSTVPDESVSISAIISREFDGGKEIMEKKY